VHALCNIHALLTNGLLRTAEQAESNTPDENFTIEFASSCHPIITCSGFIRERREHRIFQDLLKGIPGLEERLMTGSEDEVAVVAELVSSRYSLRDLIANLIMQVRKGVSGARGDDTKSLKGAVLEWITPKGQVLNPPLARNVKLDRGFHHERTGALLCPIDLDWANQE
jgi:hypothetical protein